MKHLRAAILGLATLLPSAARGQCPDGSPPPCRAVNHSGPSPRSLAVLYFENSTGDSGDAYLAEGLTEAVITQLGRIDRISVKSRSAVRRFRGPVLPAPATIGRTLGVAYLVTGSLQRAGHQLRVTIELARAATGTRAWGDQFVRSDDSLFALQDDIARRVAQGVAGRLLPAERRAVAAVRATHIPLAYRRLLQGNHDLAQRTSEGMARATEEYRQAAALDSGFVSALARVGLAYALRLDWGWDPSGKPPADSLLAQGMAAADEALRRDPLNSDAWLARGYLLQFRDARTWAEVLPAFRRAVALDSGNAEAWHQLGDAAESMGDDSTAVTAWRRALAIDPQRPITLQKYADHVPSAEAGTLLDSALAVDPAFFVAHLSRANHRLQLGDTAGARRDLAAAQCEPCRPDMWPSWTAWLAQAHGSIGDTAVARAMAESVLARLPATGGLGWRVAQPLATWRLQTGDSAGALDVLERIEPRGVVVWRLLEDGFTALETNPRFRRLVSDAWPPWAPPERRVLDLPIPEAARRRWAGTYSGFAGRIRIYSLGDSLMVGSENRGAGARLLYQGADTLVASWDRDVVIIFDDTAGGRAYRFTATARKRVFPFTRID